MGAKSSGWFAQQAKPGKVSVREGLLLESLLGTQPPRFWMTYTWLWALPSKGFGVCDLQEWLIKEAGIMEERQWWQAGPVGRSSWLRWGSCTRKGREGWGSFKIFVYFYFMCIHECLACMHVCVPRAWLVPTEDIRSVGSPGSGVIDSCKLPCGCWEPNLSPYMSSKCFNWWPISLQPRRIHFKRKTTDPVRDRMW